MVWRHSHCNVLPCAASESAILNFEIQAPWSRKPTLLRVCHVVVEKVEEEERKPTKTKEKSKKKKEKKSVEEYSSPNKTTSTIEIEEEVRKTPIRSRKTKSILKKISTPNSASKNVKFDLKKNTTKLLNYE